MATGTKSNLHAMVAAERVVRNLTPTVIESSGRTRLGPFVINYRMNDQEAHVDASIKLGGLKAKLFSATLTRKKRSVSASAKALVIKASLSIVADFDKMSLVATGKVCHKRIKWLNTEWKCNTMSARLT